MVKVQTNGNGKIYVSPTGGVLLGNDASGDISGEYLVKVIDYDGTILKSDHLDTGATFTLPSQPSHEGLTFQGWSSPVTINDNTVVVSNSDITIGAMYNTSSGLSEFDITLTKANGLSVTFIADGTKNWGDGTSNTETTHTYSIAGDYTITWDGSTMEDTSSYIGLFGQQEESPNSCVRRIRFSNSVTSINDGALTRCYSLESITIPNSVTSINDGALAHCYLLNNVVIPNSVTTIGRNIFYQCCLLDNVVIPNSVTSIDSGTFCNCYSLKRVAIPNSVTSINDSSAFRDCHLLESITIPNSVTYIGDNAFSNCYSLKSIIIPNSVTRFGNYAFELCTNIRLYDFSNATSIPKLIYTATFSDMNSMCKIKVPSSLEESWKTATNWVAYANHIEGV
nr:MAG TPA: leucine-rich repeat protein [Caudoviricetes sp.]